MKKIIIGIVIVIIILFLGAGIYKINTIPKPIPISNLSGQSLPNSSIDTQGGQTYHSILIGTAYTHYQINSCNLNDTGILVNYGKPGIRAQVQSQLIQMRKNGIDSIRIIVWHIHDIGNNSWGVIPSFGGTVSEPYRTNMINYFTDVKQAGFKRLTVVFSPQGTNSPVKENYNSELFNENWQFLSSVRDLAKQYGTSEIHIDLLNEGGPPDYWRKRYPTIFQNWTGYVANMYINYVKQYGNSDETVSFIAPQSSKDQANRLQNLINIFQQTGLGQPHWFDMHINYAGSETLYSLQNTDTVLKQNSLAQPIIIGETSYDNQDVANSVSKFMKISKRQISEVIEWPKQYGSSCKDISENPPYGAQVYIAILNSRL